MLFVLSSLEAFCLPIVGVCVCMCVCVCVSEIKPPGNIEDSRQPPAAESRCVCVCGGPVVPRGPGAQAAADIY